MRKAISYYEEQYTCDRCKKEIKDIKTGKSFLGFPYTRRECHKFSYYQLLTFERNKFVSDLEFILPDVVYCEITEHYNGNEKTIHLCGKCRKEFEWFMKNK